MKAKSTQYVSDSLYQKLLSLAVYMLKVTLGYAGILAEILPVLYESGVVPCASHPQAREEGHQRCLTRADGPSKEGISFSKERPPLLLSLQETQCFQS